MKKTTGLVLVNPLGYRKDIFRKVEEKYNIPISIWYLGSYLTSKGISVKLIDFESDSNALERLKESARNSLAIGITMMTAQVSHGLALAKFIKEEIGNIPIIVGGIHPTLYTFGTVKSKYIDFAVYGEGEIALFELVNSIKKNKNNYLHIAGIAYKDKNGIVFNKKKKELVDHANYPDLDYSLLSKKHFTQNTIALVTSRGCPYACSFCCNSIIHEGHAVRSWSLQKIIYEVKRAVDLGFKDIFFWDDNFFQDKNKIIDFLEEVKKFDKKFTWFGNTRADYFNKRDLSVKLLSELNRYGLTRVSIGAESGSQKMLDYMKKGIKVDNILKAARYCVRANIEPSFSYMVGLPNEGTKDLRLTVKCIKKLCDILPLPKILGPMLYLPLPGSEMFNDCTRAGFTSPETIEDWARIDSGYGFSSFDRPWIKNPEMVRIIWFYSILLTASLKKIIKIIKKLSMLYRYSKMKELTLIAMACLGSILGKARYRTGFFKFPVETIIFKRFRDINSL